MARPSSLPAPRGSDRKDAGPLADKGAVGVGPFQDLLDGEGRSNDGVQHSTLADQPPGQGVASRQAAPSHPEGHELMFVHVWPPHAMHGTASYPWPFAGACEMFVGPGQDQGNARLRSLRAHRPLRSHQETQSPRWASSCIAQVRQQVEDGKPGYVAPFRRETPGKYREDGKGEEEGWASRDYTGKAGGCDSILIIFGCFSAPPG